MLTEVIINPIETPRGYKNPTTGIPLRGPLSQFFSAIYLKPLDDAFNKMDVTYIRYQDDLIVFCKTKRQLNLCRRKMMDILHERQLKLSRKKSRIGLVSKGFHFLGIDYPGTQPRGHTKSAADSISSLPKRNDYILVRGGGGRAPCQRNQGSTPFIIPHARTLRKAREQVKVMVATGFSTHRIKSYLKKWAVWWAMTSATWNYDYLLSLFAQSCWDSPTAEFAARLLFDATVSRTVSGDVRLARNVA